MVEDDVALTKLGRLAREGVHAPPTPERDAAGEARLVQTIAQAGGAARPSAPRRAAFVAAAAALLMVALVVWWPRRALRFSVEGEPARSDYVSAPDNQGIVAGFSDGSRVELLAGSSMRVTELTASGARISLERGAARVSVVPRPSARWSVSAGPCVIHVTGTDFTVEWAREEQTLRVHLREGSVRVEGPPVPEGILLRAGQDLVFDLRKGTTHIANGDEPAPTAAVIPAPALPAAPALPEPSTSVTASTSAAPAPAEAPPPSWSKRVAMGDFEGVMADVEKRGIDRALRQSSLDDLVALADAARYSKRGDLARRALLEMRSRFPSSSNAKSAAFLLGRMADDGGSPGAAIQWYDVYLSEAPSGSLAAEALGRKMLVIRRTSGRDAARPIAEEYLRRFPRGGHAKIAKELAPP